MFNRWGVGHGCQCFSRIAYWASSTGGEWDIGCQCGRGSASGVLGLALAPIGGHGSQQKSWPYVCSTPKAAALARTQPEDEVVGLSSLSSLLSSEESLDESLELLLELLLESLPSSFSCKWTNGKAAAQLRGSCYNTPGHCIDCQEICYQQSSDPVLTVKRGK